jgi:hypothetical protein
MEVPPRSDFTKAVDRYRRHGGVSKLWTDETGYRHVSRSAVVLSLARFVLFDPFLSGVERLRPALQGGRDVGYAF